MVLPGSQKLAASFMTGKCFLGAGVEPSNTCEKRKVAEKKIVEKFGRHSFYRWKRSNASHGILKRCRHRARKPRAYLRCSGAPTGSVKRASFSGASNLVIHKGSYQGWITLYSVKNTW